MNSKHLSNSSKWYTPLEIVNRSKNVLGSIDLDPSSCLQANKLIQANNIFTKRDNALFKDWNIYNSPINVFMNPPSGKYGKHNLPVVFWIKLMDLMNKGHLNHASAIIYVNSIVNEKDKFIQEFSELGKII